MNLPVYSPKGFGRAISVPLNLLLQVAANADSYYRTSTKMIGRKERTIDDPREPLKSIQRRINGCILRNYELPDYVVGGVYGRNPLHHPFMHVGKQVVVTLDVKDCFPSISHRWVYDIWNVDFKFPPDVARLVTLLTTFKGHLPIGAPTSTALANLALLPIVKRAAEIARPRGLEPSQFIDDMAVSGERLDSELITLIVREFSKAGLSIKRSKILIMRSGGVQLVTNKVVNQGITASRGYRANLRAAIHQLRHLEPESPQYVRIYNTTRGRLFHLRSLHPKWSNARLTELVKLCPASAS